MSDQVHVAQSAIDVVGAFLGNAQTPVGGVFVVSCIILFTFVIIVWKMDNQSPFRDHVLTITGVCIFAPVLLFLGVTEKIEADAVTGLLGIMVGYFFQNKNNRT